MSDCVYVIRAVGTILHKVGRTNGKAKHRMASLACGSPLALELIAEFPVLNAKPLEKAIHRQLQEFHSHGEWFAIDPEILRLYMDEWRTTGPLCEVKYPVVKDGILVLPCRVEPDGVGVTTETCPFCGVRHRHGTGGKNWRERIHVVEGHRTLGHRVAHCDNTTKGWVLVPGRGHISNRNGYYLGVA